MKLETYFWEMGEEFSERIEVGVDSFPSITLSKGMLVGSFL